MTRIEAIKILKYNSNVIHQTINGETDPKEVEALDMAIKALESEIVLFKSGLLKDCESCKAKQEYVFDKIIVEIQRLRGCSCSCSDGIIDDVEDIIDKYKAGGE